MKDTEVYSRIDLQSVEATVGGNLVSTMCVCVFVKSVAVADEEENMAANAFPNSSQRQLIKSSPFTTGSHVQSCLESGRRKEILNLSYHIFHG